MCGRNFSSPIKAENLGSKNVEVYDACPYCLTEILVEETHTAVEKLQEEPEKEEEMGPVSRPKMPVAEREPARPELKVQGCNHHFGYLGDRSSKEKIPDECITCENIVKCMLKNVAT